MAHLPFTHSLGGGNQQPKRAVVLVRNPCADPTSQYKRRMHTHPTTRTHGQQSTYTSAPTTSVNKKDTSNQTLRQPSIQATKHKAKGKLHIYSGSYWPWQAADACGWPGHRDCLLQQTPQTQRPTCPACDERRKGDESAPESWYPGVLVRTIIPLELNNPKSCSFSYPCPQKR